MNAQINHTNIKDLSAFPQPVIITQITQELRRKVEFYSCFLSFLNRKILLERLKDISIWIIWTGRLVRAIHSLKWHNCPQESILKNTTISENSHHHSKGEDQITDFQWYSSPCPRINFCKLNEKHILRGKKSYGLPTQLWSGCKLVWLQASAKPKAFPAFL